MYSVHGLVDGLVDGFPIPPTAWRGRTEPWSVKGSFIHRHRVAGAPPLHRQMRSCQMRSCPLLTVCYEARLLRHDEFFRPAPSGWNEFA